MYIEVGEGRDGEHFALSVHHMGRQVTSGSVPVFLFYFFYIVMAKEF